ncbi:hypothetical protein TWF696_007893 [Orbilia brochopaga]|uniref:F-box domain-containing protein n=1 Tax=Orbilia brochopaga TaxID=3140254 RepID=A0AAV9ULW6_9PEZI
MSQLLQLPAELIEHTLSFIEAPDDIFNISKVSRRLYNVSTPFRYQTLVVAIPSRGVYGYIKWNPQKAFAKVSEPWYRHLKHLEISYYRPDEPYRPWKLRIPGVSGSEVRAVNHTYTAASMRLLNLETLSRYLLGMIERLPQGQLRSFTPIIRDDPEIEVYAVAIDIVLFMCISATQNNLTSLAIEVNAAFIADCTECDFPHLKSLGLSRARFHAHAEDHAILSLLYNCQNTLIKLVWVITEFASWSAAEYLALFREAYEEWRQCERCCQSGGDPAEQKSIVLSKLKTWRVYNMEGDFIQLLYDMGIMKGASVANFSLTYVSEFLDMASENGDLKLDVLLPRLFQQRHDGGVLGSHLMTFRGLTTFALQSQDSEFFGAGWGMWFDGLKCHAASLRCLNISFAGLPISQTRLTHLGMSCRNLEFVTLEMEDRLPFGILDKTFFPKLKYFRNPKQMYPIRMDDVSGPQEDLRLLIDSNICEALADGVLSGTLRIVAFGSPGVGDISWVSGLAFRIERGLEGSPKVSVVTGNEESESGEAASIRTRAMTRLEYMDAMKGLSGYVDYFDIAPLDTVG